MASVVTAAMRAVAFADDDTMPARDLASGEMLGSGDGLRLVSDHDPASETGAGARPVGTGAASGVPRRVGRRPVDLAEAARATAPVTLAGERRFDVGDALEAVLPDGIRRGSTVGLTGVGSLSLALAAAAAPTTAGSWLAVVGADDLCPAAAEQLGVALHRTLLVDEPPRASWGPVLAALVDAVDLVLVDGRGIVAGRQAQRLLTRLRERGGVVLDVGGVWPEAHDVRLEVVGGHWDGLGDGHGLLVGRRLQVRVQGRRGAARPREAELWLPGRPAELVRLLDAAGGARHAPDATGADDVRLDGEVAAGGRRLAFAGADIDALVAAVPLDDTDDVAEVDDDHGLAEAG